LKPAGKVVSSPSDYSGGKVQKEHTEAVGCSHRQTLFLGDEARNLLSNIATAVHLYYRKADVNTQPECCSPQMCHDPSLIMADICQQDLFAKLCTAVDGISDC